jgi:hypothetical protein
MIPVMPIAPETPNAMSEIIACVCVMLAFAFVGWLLKLL